MSDIKSKYESFMREYNDYVDFQTHRNLNHMLWDRDTDELKKEISDRLIEIAQDFIESSEIADVEIKDITFTGSLANYNYSQYSDIDLHIIINFADVDENVELVKEYFDNKKALWNLKHYIMIHGFEVEIYVQDESERHMSSGVYSIMNSEWIKKPTPEDPDLDYDNIKKKADDFKRQIDQVFKLQTQDKHQEAIDYAAKLKEKIRKFRQAGLEDEGEFSVENLAFKMLRRDGSLDTLSNVKVTSYDQMMSIDEEEVMQEHFDSWREFSKDSPSVEENENLLKEYFYSFLPMVNFTDRTMNDMTPPASSIEEVLQAWVVDDYKIYDEMMYTDNVGYHTQLPTKEIMNVMKVDPEMRYSGGKIERINRRRRIVDEGHLKQPVVIAVGRNGKAAITFGDKELIAAYEAGLKDVPVVFEYHPRV